MEEAELLKGRDARELDLEGMAGAEARVWQRTENANNGELPRLAEVW